MTPFMEAAVKMGGQEWNGRLLGLHRVYLPRWIEAVGVQIRRGRDEMGDVRVIDGTIDGWPCPINILEDLMIAKAYVDANGLNVEILNGPAADVQRRLIDRLKFLLADPSERLQFQH